MHCRSRIRMLVEQRPLARTGNLPTHMERSEHIAPSSSIAVPLTALQSIHIGRLKAGFVLRRHRNA
jgi:hypothetical protein